MIEAERERSVNRSPSSDWLPCDSLRWMTGPRNWSAERSLSGVVGGVDAGDRDERPERGPQLQEVVREPAKQAVAFAAVAGMLEQLAQLALDGCHLSDEPGAVLMFGECVPGLKQPVSEREASFSELLLGGQPFAVEPEVAL